MSKTPYQEGLMRAQPDYPFVTAVIEIFADWLKRRQDRTHDLEGLSRSDLHDIAKDIGVSVDELQKLERSGSEQLMLPRMMAVLGLDPDAVNRADPILFRDLQRVCALCDEKTRCARAFAKGDAATTYETFCPNSSSLKAVA
jgi:uncharacterized protein YjiS (DUF1127 family)